MGQIMKITCAACKKEWECIIGCGLSHARLQDVVYEFSQEVAADITREVGKELFSVFEFAYHISKCDCCGNMVSIPILQLADRDIDYIGTCPVCGDEAEPVDEIGDISCPACGEEALSAEEAGHWD